MHSLFLFLVLPALLLAEKTGVKVEDFNTDKDTTITIKKGVKADAQCVEYEIIEGTEEISGNPEFDRSKARSLWKEACKEWKDNLTSLNKANSVIHLSCGSPSGIKEEENKTTFKSTATYKVKVKMKEKASD